MRIEPFKCEVKKISYHIIEKASNLSNLKHYCKLDVEAWENVKGEYYQKDDAVYLANVNVEEKKQGGIKGKRRKGYNMTIYITENQYNNQVIEIGDILKINKSKLTTDNCEIIVYDKEKVKQYPKHMITKNDKGYAQVKLKTTTCKISVGLEDWEIAIKGSQANYFKVDGNEDLPGSRIKFYVENKDSLLNDLEFNFYLEDKELEELHQLNGEIVDLKFYSHKQVKKKGMAELHIIFDKEMEMYYMRICNINRF